MKQPEQRLWDRISPSLIGRRWTRLESRGTTSGVGDAFGFFRKETHWIELKVGRPSMTALRSSQHDFIIDCVASNIPVWCCFEHNGRLFWYQGLPVGDPITPPFYRPDLSHRRVFATSAARS